jgi:hypothetical protein
VEDSKQAGLQLIFYLVCLPGLTGPGGTNHIDGGIQGGPNTISPRYRRTPVPEHFAYFSGGPDRTSLRDLICVGLI